MKGAVLAILASQSVVTTEAFWGFRGHEATAVIAEYFLNAEAREASEFLLGGPGGLVRESTWADGYRNDPVYGWTGALHYFNTPDWGKRICEAAWREKESERGGRKRGQDNTPGHDP
jgi:hypothetical protein